jgi:hypothetical protein
MSQQAAQPPKRRYNVIEADDSYLIDGGPDRVPVRVTLAPTSWLVEANRQFFHFGLFQQSALAERIAQLLMSRWQPRSPQRRFSWRMREWAVQRTLEAIKPRVRWQARRLLPKIDPTVLDVQRALFAATFGTGSLALDESFYRKADRFLLSDVIRYRAAAIAVRNIAEPWGCNSFNLPICGYLDTDRALDYLANWRGLFSPTRQPYPILNKVLMNLPGCMSHHLVCRLSLIELERPIHDRVELTLLCAGTDSPHRRHEHVFQHARREQIQRALWRVAASTHNTWTTRRSADLKAFALYLGDCDEKHHGNIVGLADKVIRWHRDAHRNQVRQLLGHLRGDQPAALPPIELPEQPGIRFLARVDDIVREGEEMLHCVASYAHKAVQGGCYLFHVEHEGEAASVEVGPDGQVRQAYGRHNRRNQAAAWGERVLRRWGERFPSEVRERRTTVLVGGWPGDVDEEIPF